MLDYEWGNPSAMMLPGEEAELGVHHHHHHHPDPTRQSFLDHYASPAFNENNNNNNNHHFLTNPNSNHHDHHNHHEHQHQHHLSNANGSSHQSPFANHLFNQPLHSHHNHHHHSLFSPFGAAAGYAGAGGAGMVSLDAPAFVLVPKAEESAEVASRIGLNLGGRTYFSSSEDDFMSRLYRRPRALEGSSAAAANSPRCQAEGCNADLSHAKHYHRRHKVCEFHSKASTVIASGLTQRFCQQCSRFHLLSEFDNGKRSCRKRLADHNRRRRKTQQQPNQDTTATTTKSSSSHPPEDSLTTTTTTTNNNNYNNPSSDHSVARIL